MASSTTSGGDYRGKSHQVPVQLYDGHPTYSCAKCSAVIALQDELISKAFSGRDGRGFLMQSAVNVKLGKREDRSLMFVSFITAYVDLLAYSDSSQLCRTGVHTVADAFCVGCDERIGWYYHKAADPSQKYKESKYLLEREKIVKENNWTLDE
ncbi:yippee-like protein [Coprinellus micaceus]|uniref:Protein yippee-like n=1 Tax=Coprinellus micaceus TaxID=71717 RepID=A0A4Y7TT89_COPMI|nr:yippee-like protein [Coprinellus micaceus]